MWSEDRRKIELKVSRHVPFPFLTAYKIFLIWRRKTASKWTPLHSECPQFVSIVGGPMQSNVDDGTASQKKATGGQSIGLRPNRSEREHVMAGIFCFKDTHTHTRQRKQKRQLYFNEQDRIEKIRQINWFVRKRRGTSRKDVLENRINMRVVSHWTDAFANIQWARSRNSAGMYLEVNEGKWIS